MTFLLNWWSVREPSPFSSVNALAGTNESRAPVREQMEQLSRAAARRARGGVAGNRQGSGGRAAPARSARPSRGGAARDEPGSGAGEDRVGRLPRATAPVPGGGGAPAGGSRNSVGVSRRHLRRRRSRGAEQVGRALPGLGE